jgi:hypothetical protein
MAEITMPITIPITMPITMPNTIPNTMPNLLQVILPRIRSQCKLACQPLPGAGMNTRPREGLDDLVVGVTPRFGEATLAQTPEHLLSHCIRWKFQLLALWKKVGKATGWKAG